MSHVLYVLAGLIVGAVLTFVSTSRTDARRNRLQARGIARLLFRDVFNGTMLIHAGLAQKSWPLDENMALPFHVPNQRFNVENWNRLGATFAASMSDYDDWESVCIAFESMENENRLMDEGDERAFNPDRLNRVRDRDLMGALEVLTRLQMPLRRRLWRDARMRRLDADFYLPRERLKKRDD